MAFATMDALHLCIALTPLAAYLALLAWIHIRHRPSVVSGWADVLLLGIGICGLAVAGPLELFLPESAAFRYGWFVWLLMLALYFLLVVLVTLSLRPRIVIYNFSGEQLRAILSESARELDSESHWAGNSLVMPHRRVSLYIECSPHLHNVQLVSAGGEQDLASWRRLRKNLVERLAQVTCPIRRSAALYAGGALAIVLILLLVVAREQETITRSLVEMLRL
jgi:hypothetical protein